MKHKIITLALALLAGATVPLALAPPASAAFADCGNGLMCAWSGSYATGTKWNYAFSVYGPSGTCRNLSGSQNNAWRSAYNRYGSALNVEVYWAASCPPYPNFWLNNGMQALDGLQSTSSFRIYSPL